MTYSGRELNGRNLEGRTLYGNLKQVRSDMAAARNQPASQIIPGMYLPITVKTNKGDNKVYVHADLLGTLHNYVMQNGIPIENIVEKGARPVIVWQRNGTGRLEIPPELTAKEAMVAPTPPRLDEIMASLKPRSIRG